MNRNDLYSLLTAPDVRTLQGIVTRIAAGGKVFVTVPGFDGNSEFGPVFYSGVTPTDGAVCLVAVVNNTTEAWIISWDGANSGLAPAMIMMNAIPVGNPGAAAWRLQSYNTFDNQAPSMFTPLAGPGPFTYGWVRVEQSGYYRVTANWMADRATSAEMTLAIQALGVNGVISRQESYFSFIGPSPGWSQGMTGVCELFLPAGTGIGNQVYYDTALNPQYCSFVVERLGGVVGPPGPAGPPGPGTSVQRVWTPSGADAGSANFTVANPFTDANAVPARIDYTPVASGMVTFEHQTIFRNFDGAYQRLDTNIDIVRVSDGAVLGTSPISIIAQYVGQVWQTQWTRNSLPVLGGVPIYGLARYGGAISGTWNYWQGASYQKMRMLFTPA